MFFTESPTEKQAPDIKIWPPIYIERVTKLIAEQIPIQIEKALPTPVAAKQAALRAVVPDGVSQFEPNKPLIVISAHPQQYKISLEIKSAFEECDYQVWCSTDGSEEGEGGGVDIDPNTPPSTPSQQLPTISEEANNTAFSEHYKDVARRLLETSDGAGNRPRPVSLPVGGDQHMKPPLHRIASNISEPNRYSSLSPEKKDKLRAFQESVQAAQVVIVLSSESYFKSRTSQQHVFYCEHRKKVILVRCDNSDLPNWFSMLMGNELGIVSSGMHLN